MRAAMLSGARRFERAHEGLGIRGRHQERAPRVSLDQHVAVGARDVELDHSAPLRPEPAEASPQAACADAQRETELAQEVAALERAHERVAKHGFAHVRLLQMDATSLSFPDDSYDIVYAPYLISVVPDPVAVAREMRRVCRPGGRIIILNHFRSSSAVLSAIERAISPFTVHIGFKSDLDLPAFLAQADLRPVTIEKVNIPPIWSLVTCIKD